MRYALLILYLCLDITNGVQDLCHKSNGFSSQIINKDFYSISKKQQQVKHRILLDILISSVSFILQFLPRKYPSLLVRRNTFLVLNLGFHVTFSIVLELSTSKIISLQSISSLTLCSQCLHKYLHINN